MRSTDGPISIPDRFEVLSRKAEEKLPSIIVKVDNALKKIDAIYADMRSAGRGAFLVLRGDSGAGKTTFLHTVGQYRESVVTTSVPPDVDIRTFLDQNVNSGKTLHIFVLEEREVAIEFSDSELETLLHGVNAFIRGASGSNALVVWPCNTNALRDRVVGISSALGGSALLGTGDSSYQFTGPEKLQYIPIAERTISVLNEGASFSDLGITISDATDMADDSDTIGGFLSAVRSKITDNEKYVESLFDKEQCQLWVVVVSGDEPDKDVAALTRGQHSALDIERLLSATDANIVKELKKFPQKLGVLGSVMNGKIFHLPVLTALATSRAFADSSLAAKMKARDIVVGASKEADAIRRLSATDLAKLLKSGSQGTLTRGSKIGSNTEAAFVKLAEIARTNDIDLNRALGVALQRAGLIKSFQLEQDFGEGLTRRTDIRCETDIGIVRIEMMWRSKTSRAEIANYVLGKLQNYGKAIGFLD